MQIKEGRSAFNLPIHHLYKLDSLLDYLPRHILPKYREGDLSYNLV